MRQEAVVEIGLDSWPLGDQNLCRGSTNFANLFYWQEDISVFFLLIWHILPVHTLGAREVCPVWIRRTIRIISARINRSSLSDLVCTNSTWSKDVQFISERESITKPNQSIAFHCSIFTLQTYLHVNIKPTIVCSFIVSMATDELPVAIITSLWSLLWW